VRLERLQITADLNAYPEKLGTEGFRRTTGVPNFSAGDFEGHNKFLSTLHRLSSTLSCSKIIFTGVLWEDDQYA
jgi:hypothetical protein